MNTLRVCMFTTHSVATFRLIIIGLISIVTCIAALTPNFHDEREIARRNRSGSKRIIRIIVPIDFLYKSYINLLYKSVSYIHFYRFFLFFFFCNSSKNHDLLSY